MAQKKIAAGQVCEELVQNIDLVTTLFELGQAEKPKAYRIDGQSLTPLLKNGKAKDWRNHLYLEMGTARATFTKDWSYIAVRYTKEQAATIKKATPRNLPRAMAYIGRLGIGVRGADRPGFFDEDQLYHLKRDPKEMKNLAYEKAQASRIKLTGAFSQRISKTASVAESPVMKAVPGEFRALQLLGDVDLTPPANHHVGHSCPPWEYSRRIAVNPGRHGVDSFRQFFA